MAPTRSLCKHNLRWRRLHLSVQCRGTSVRVSFPRQMGQDPFLAHHVVAWDVRPYVRGDNRPGLLRSAPVSDPLGWQPELTDSQSLISGIRQKSIIKEPSPSGGSLLVSTERQEYLGDFFFHPSNFSPLYNISFQYNPVSGAP